MKHVIHIAIVVFLFATVGMNQTKTDSAQNMLVQTDWVAAHQKDAGVVILHVGMDRTAYDAGHISGARFLAWSDITTTRNNVPNQLPAADVLKTAFERVGVGDQSRVVIYGDTPLLSAYTYFALDYLGQANHAVLDGGLEKWKSEKRLTSRDRPEVKAAVLTVKPHPELLVDMAGVQRMVAEKKVPLIDGRPPEQYSGANPGDGIKRGGHIPGAHNLFWMQTLVSKENPVLKPVSDIRALYESAGAKTGGDVLVYCRTGLIATHEYFTLKLAGFRPVLYDGSFMEWSNATGTAIETGSGGSQ